MTCKKCGAKTIDKGTICSGNTTYEVRKCIDCKTENLMALGLTE